ncbi:unnamed protein product [Pleuronectes platessa]|uniref:Uncharacterized protein n=1 Tax=Pleuronectes platessa TaxID=8262 RepID=A0A9N7W030_PLEPL|nr:unnamed protein product [Pleuronectes platessa]
MTEVLNIFQYIFPVLVVSIAVVLLCFYVHAKNKRAVYDVTTPTTQDNNPAAVNNIVSSEDEEDRHYDRLPPPYSSLDHPPPYSLFDPVLASLWPADSLPALGMYPIMLPLASHH